MELPAPLALWRIATALEPAARKTVLGFALMAVDEPKGLRDREWCARRLAESAALAHGLAETPSLAAMEQLSKWLTERADLLLPTALAIFASAARDLAARAQGTALTAELARAAILAYFADEPDAAGLWTRSGDVAPPSDPAP